jgi:hypothetical protein
MGSEEGFVRQVVRIIMTNYFGGAEVAWAYRVLITPAPEGGSRPPQFLTVLLGIPVALLTVLLRIVRDC